MAKCVTKRRKKTRLCVGDLDELIVIHDRDITAPEFNSVKATEDYTKPDAIWASVNTVREVELFDSNNQRLGVVTHQFGIEFINRMLSIASTRIEFDKNYYKLLRQVDFEERKEYLLLDCELIGPKAQEVNQ